MAEQDKTESKLAGLLDHLPVMDGGSRRRFTAGALVILTLLLVFDGGEQLKRAIIERDISVTLLVASGTLLVYGTGVIVELIGEVFLARAIGNVVGAYESVYEEASSWKGWKQESAWVFVAVKGTLRLVPYFLLGLFGGSRWRMHIRGRLNGDTQAVYDELPRSLRDAIEQPLGSTAEFGRHALIERLKTPASRKWARQLMNRPRDVLAIVSAIVLSLMVAIFGTSTAYKLDAGLVSRLMADRAEVEKTFDRAMPQVKTALEKFRDRVLEETKQADGSSSTGSTKPGSWDEAFSQLGTEASSAIDSIETDLYGMNVDTADLMRATVTDTVVSENEIGPLAKRLLSAVQGSTYSLSASELAKKVSDLQKLRVFDAALIVAVTQASDSQVRLRSAAKELYAEVAWAPGRRALVQAACLISAMFLYVAFFITLRSATVSVLEGLALERETHTVLGPMATLASSTVENASSVVVENESPL